MNGVRLTARLIVVAGIVALGYLLAVHPEAVLAYAAALKQHPMVEGVGGGALLVAAISCLPKKMPRTPDDWYAYFRDTFQTAVPAARHPKDTEPGDAGPTTPAPPPGQP